MTGVEIAFHHERPIDPQAVRELYTSVNWWPLRTPEEIAQANALPLLTQSPDRPRVTQGI